MVQMNAKHLLDLEIPQPNMLQPALRNHSNFPAVDDQRDLQTLQVWKALI